MPRLWSVAMSATFQGLEAIGLDRAELCAKTGIEQAVLDDPEGRIPIDRTSAVWEVASEIYEGPVALHAGAAVPFGALEALDYAAFTAATVADALRVIIRYFDIVSEGATQLGLVRAEDGLWHMTFGGARASLLVRDYATALLAGRLRRMGAKPNRIELAGPPLASLAEYEGTLGVPVAFHADTTALVLDDESLSRPLDRFPGLHDVVVREAQRILAGLEGDDFITGLRTDIASLIPAGKPTVEELARLQHMSVRTLQRRLSDEGWTFTSLVDDTRAELARMHLGSPRLSTAEVAYLVGFSEPASLSRACRRWFGRPPTELRALGRESS